MNIDHSLASSQNHRSVGRAENIHKIILASLRKLCDTQTDWPRFIPGLLLALHSTVIIPTGLTPAFMVYHRELRTPLTLTLPVNLDSSDQDFTK